MISEADVGALRCPTCRARLTWSGEPARGRLVNGALSCDGCGARWPVEEGLARLYREEAVTGTDRLMRHFYDGLPRLHDPVVKYTLPLFQSGTEGELREGYMRRLDLASLTPRADGAPLRVLEVGVGCGSSLPLIARDLPRGAPAEIWGCDLSAGMLGVLRDRQRRRPDARVRWVQCDAHALPFPDAWFDRVLHVGAINGFRDQRAALAEMARVAAPGTPIVVVDERLDPGRRHHLYYRAMFKLVTFYDQDPHAPIEHLPRGAHAVRDEQLSRFFYCLTFRMPEGA